MFKGCKSDVKRYGDKRKSFPETEAQDTEINQGIREMKQFALNEQNGFRSCTLINIAKIALRENRPLKFDSDKLEFIDDVKANAYLNPPARGRYGV